MLSGAKVELTEVRPEDSDVLFKWINDPETMHFNSSYLPITQFSHQKWYEKIGTDNTKVIFAIRVKNANKPIGYCQLIDIQPVHRSAEVIIRIGEEESRGRGFGTEALSLLVEYAWEDLNLERIWLRVFANNERAIKAYQKVGFQSEGTMQHAAWINGQWMDLNIMAILRKV